MNLQEEPAAKDPRGKAPEKEKEKEVPATLALRKVRHGYGAQIFETADEEECKKYEGQWERDRRHGYGHCFYRDGGFYSGCFRNDLREGFGRMVWEEGWEYEGFWKEGRLSGKGSFKTLEVFSLSSSGFLISLGRAAVRAVQEQQLLPGNPGETRSAGF